MSDSESDYADLEIEQAWNIGCSSVIPEKSKDRYENTYRIFKSWCEEKGCGINEKVLLAYMVRRNEKLKSPGSLWAEYSMLKSTIFLRDKIDISKFATLIAFLKRKNVGHKPKKAAVFTKEHMRTFLKEAPDEEYLILKVGMILGISGACRREELYTMCVENIEDKNTFLIVRIPNTKTHIQRTFTVIDEDNDDIQYVEICRKYFRLRPQNTKSQHLFLKYHKGKCSNQVVGKGTIGGWPSKIAGFLKLKNLELFTGHSFRRSSATFLANKGVDVLGLKRHGGWRSSTVAESYVEDSLENKLDFAKKNLHTGEGDRTKKTCESSASSVNRSDEGASSSTELTIVNAASTAVSVNPNTKEFSGIAFNNCTNCTFNFNFK